MSSLARHRMPRIFITSVFFICSHLLSFGQNDLQVAQFTSREGLPQNSIRGLAFDPHGFLWLATEGGITRFDGKHFKHIDDNIHPGLNNQRFTRILACIDSSIIFTDLFNGIYMLSKDRFTTLQRPDLRNKGINSIYGGAPDPQFLLRDTFFRMEVLRLRQVEMPTITILPSSKQQVYVISDRVIYIDRKNKSRRIISDNVEQGQQFAMFNGELLRFDNNGQLYQWHEETSAFKHCLLTAENNLVWPGSFEDAVVYSVFPFEDVFIKIKQQLFKLVSTKDPNHFNIQLVIDRLPGNCKITAVAFRKSDRVLTIGTDTKGLFTYQQKHLETFIYHGQDYSVSNSYYAQCLLDSSLLLASNGLILDYNNNTTEGIFQEKFNPYLLANDHKGNIYFVSGLDLIRYSLENKEEHRISSTIPFSTHSLILHDNKIWLGTTEGIGYIRNDSVQWEYKIKSRNENFSITCLNIDAAGRLWFGTYFQLYRFDQKTQQLDSFPELANADTRTLTFIRHKLFAGTYGSGYMVYDRDHFVRMPIGRYNELSTTHAFIEDKYGYLWITTNRGLYKTHLDAIDAFLGDTTSALDYYAYLEEEGIKSTEFNGGCSPPYLWLPDGRLSLPTIEGLVMFNPATTINYFPKDTMIFESVVVDGKTFSTTRSLQIPPNHANMVIHFAGAFWKQPKNQYISYKLEGIHQTFQLCDENQTSYSIGHLKPGQYTFLLRRRAGFGPKEYVYSTLHFTVLKPWYAKNWAFGMYGIGFFLIVWGTIKLYTRSIRQRNIELEHKVNEQTKVLKTTNLYLEDNLSKLALSEGNLRKNIRVRDRLISIITHDILTPLRFIGQIARLGGEEKPNEEGLPKRALTDVQNAVHKLFHSTQNLLHWVTFHQEHFNTYSTNCSPFALVEQLIEDFSEMSKFQGNILVNEVPEDDVILTDPRILNIILHNLLSNAIKYTKNGHVLVRSRTEDNWYVFEVSDSGRGMTQAQLEAVREGITREGEVMIEDISAGTGIGLSLVADLMQALKGRWEIDSPDKIGVRVRIYLPQ